MFRLQKKSGTGINTGNKFCLHRNEHDDDDDEHDEHDGVLLLMITATSMSELFLYF